jgi:hypothetical protein
MFKFKPIDVTKLPYKNLIIVCLSGVCFASIYQCSDKAVELEHNEGNWKFRYASMVDSFETTVNDQGEQLAYQDQLLINEKQAKDLLAMENSSLKKLSSSTKTKTVTKIEKVYVPLGEVVSARELSDTNEINSTDTVGSSYRPFGLSTEWYSMQGKVFDDGLSIDSLSITNEITTNIGWKRDKWYKKKYAVVEVKNTNPYTQVTGMQNVVVKPPKKLFFQTTGFKVGAGLLGGAYLGIRLTK